MCIEYFNEKGLMKWNAHAYTHTLHPSGEQSHLTLSLSCMHIMYVCCCHQAYLSYLTKFIWRREAAIICIYLHSFLDSHSCTLKINIEIYIQQYFWNGATLYAVYTQCWWQQTHTHTHSHIISYPIWNLTILSKVKLNKRHKPVVSRTRIHTHIYNTLF